MRQLPSKTTGCALSSKERETHRDWIGGRVLTLLSHYFRPDDPVQLTGAIAKDWADVLEGLPRDCIQRACLAYMRRESAKRPTPGAIYQIAKSMLPKPQAPARQVMGREEQDAYLQMGGKISPERAEQARRIMQEIFPTERRDG